MQRSWLAGLLLLVFVSCQKQDANPEKQFVYTGPLLETTNVVTLISDSAKLQVRLTGPLEQQFENGDMLYPKSVQVIFYSKDGQQVVNTLRGDYGKYDKNKNLYLLRGNVRVKNDEKQQRMYTKELFYDKQKNFVYTDSTTFAQIVTPTDSLTGYGLTYNMTSGRYKFLKPTGTFITQLSAGSR